MPRLELDSDIGINAMFEQSMQWITDGFIPQRPNQPMLFEGIELLLPSIMRHLKVQSTQALKHYLQIKKLQQSTPPKL